MSDTRKLDDSELEANHLVFAAKAKGELPGGLRCLLFVYDWLCAGKPRHTDDWRDDWANTIEDIFDRVGLYMYISPKETAKPVSQIDFDTIYETSTAKIAIAIIGEPAVLKKWLGGYDGSYSLRNLGVNMWGPDGLANETVIEFSTLASFVFGAYGNGKNGEFLISEDLYWTNSHPYNFAQLGDFSGWIATAQATDRNFAELKALVEVADGSVDKIKNNRPEAGPRLEPLRLVPGSRSHTERLCNAVARK
jgi:hypothetical protein